MLWVFFFFSSLLPLWLFLLNLTGDWLFIPNWVMQKAPLFSLPALFSLWAIRSSPIVSGDATSSLLSPYFCVRPMPSSQMCILTWLSHWHLKLSMTWTEFTSCMHLPSFSCQRPGHHVLWLSPHRPSQTANDYVLTSVSSYCHFLSSRSNSYYLHQPTNWSFAFHLDLPQYVFYRTTKISFLQMHTGIFLYLKTFCGSHDPQDKLHSPLQGKEGALWSTCYVLTLA